MAKAAGRRSLATRTSCRRAHRVGDRTKIHDLRACPEWDAARKPSFRKASKGPFRALHRSNKGTIARALSVWNESQPLLPVKGWPSERSGRLGSAQATQACLQGGTPRSMRAMRSAIIGSRGLVMGSSGVLRRAFSRIAQPFRSLPLSFPGAASTARCGGLSSGRIATSAPTP